MIKIYLSRLLGERRMTQSELSGLTGIRPNTISDLYGEFAARVNLEHLDRICEVLDCDLHELMEYVPDKHRKTGKDLIIEEHGNRRKNAKEN